MKERNAHLSKLHRYLMIALKINLVALTDDCNECYQEYINKSV